jgi:trk system potassium uptake protein
LPESKGKLNLPDVFHIVSAILLGIAVGQGLCGIVGLALGDGSFGPLMIAAVLTATVGSLGRWLTPVPQDLSYREGFLTVTLAWTAVGLAGAVPFLISGAIPSAIDAIFESMSGFTTTGSTILSDIEAVAPGLLLWRSLTQWLGGMGIIVLGIAILPYLGVGGMQLFRAEVPGPTKDRLRPRIRETAKALWLVYAGLSVVLATLFLLGGMSAFDAVNHSLTTMPTGGFSTRNESMGAFSPFVQWVTILFMFLAGINFTLHYRALSRRGLPYWSDGEWRLYAGIIVGASTLVAIATYSPGEALERTIRDATFQVVAVVTTTGYGTADFALWAPFAQVVLFLLFFVGGMAGSTSGGPKAVRVLLIVKHGFGEMRKYLHPRAVLVTKISGMPVHPEVMLNVFAFMILYVGLFGVGTLLMAGAGLSLPAAAGAAGTALSNVGPGLAEVGPTANFGFLPWGGKLVMIILMLVGRLEIYTVLLLFHPGLWKR